MAETVDELTIAYEEEGVEVVKQLEKKVLTRGNWTTIMYLFQEMNRRTNEYDPPKASIRRYQKRNGVYRQQSKFNISSAKQGKEIAATLLEWYQGADDKDDKEDQGD